MSRYRLVIYDSPEHGFSYVTGQVPAALGLPPGEGSKISHRVHFDGKFELPMEDRAKAEASMEQVLALGPDLEIQGSKGSLVVSIEELADPDVRVHRRGRLVAGQFVSMELEDVERFLGGSLDDYHLDSESAWPSSKPLLVVQGSLTWIPCAALLAVPAVFIMCAIALESGKWPWLYSGQGTPSPWALLFVFGMSATPLLGLVILRLPRSSRVELHEDHVVLASPLARRVVSPWREIRAFRDGSIDFVQLLRAGDKIADPSLAIPTRDESTRVAVLELLARKGISREE